MINIDTEDCIDIKKIIDSVEKGVELGLQDFGQKVNQDIIRESKVKKSGATRRIKINGRIVTHTSANANKGESTAELTGNQNKNRYSRASKDELIIGVNESVVYANKNERRFKDIQQGIDRNKDNLTAIIAQQIENIFNI